MAAITGREEKMLKIIHVSRIFLDLGEEPMEYGLLTDTMKDLSGAKYVAFNLFEEEGDGFETMSISGFHEDLQKAASSLGFNIVGKRWSFDPRRYERLFGESVVVYEALHELTGEVISDHLIKTLETIFDIGTVLVVPIVKNNRMLGDFTVMMEKDSLVSDFEILELYASQVGLLLSKRLEEKHREENQQKLDLVMDAIDAGAWVWDVQADQGDVSLQWMRMLGYDEKEWEPPTLEWWTSMIHPEDRDRAVQTLKQALASESESFAMEYRMRHKKGHYVWIMNRGKLMEWNSDGKPLRMFGIHLDITENKKTTEALREKEENYQVLVDSSFDIIYRLDLNGVFTFVSNAWTKLLGYSIEEAVGNSFRPFVHPDDLEGVEEFFRRIRESNTRQEHNNYRLLHKDGSWHWYTTTATPLWDEWDNVAGYVGTARDITDVKTINDQLMEKNQVLEYFFAINPDLILIASLDGRIVQVNNAWERTLGYGSSDLVGRSFLEMVHPEDVEKTKAAMGELKNDNVVWDFVNRYRSYDGTYRSLEWRSQPAGGLLYAAARDITEKLERQQEVEYLSFHDHLTGLYNRRYMDDSLKRLDTPRNLPFSVIVLDVNDLKEMNDVHGHFIGDELLKGVAQVLKETCRSDDIICRMGETNSSSCFLPHPNKK
ncbi:PAS domain S-box protein [Alkalibacter rhizosphaerae]|uniref:PAS domain S-box protein n=1 Tax=Alkalibacter rhizosphaerae TaxID=2815577 RepID=A0A975AHZ4_9FIRM|nr:PAS domain S-box protein [Alkalibacter rhizosphaerae]QSX09124.1 PAS domain S-box protein [Alkalibacter rhizosphaerae]